MMTTSSRTRTTVALALLAIAGLAFSATARAARPLKVYVLAGQSNMEGLGTLLSKIIPKPRDHPW